MEASPAPPGLMSRHRVALWLVQLGATAAVRRAGLVRPLVAALAFAVVAGAATCLLQAYGVPSEAFSLNRAPGGTFGNRNFVAHLAAIGTPALILIAMTARQASGSLAAG